jgi:hypothetical protein
MLKKISSKVKEKGKAIPVTSRGGPWGCETSRLPHFLDSRLTDGDEVVSRPQGHSAVGRIMSTEKSNDLIGNRTRDLQACSTVPQPTTLPRAPIC